MSFINARYNVPPGLIAYLYKTRWDIEKIFDQVKNKLSEKKEWATSTTAKSMQALFICLAHNLMLILERSLEKDGIVNTFENIRRLKRLEKLLKNSDIPKDKLPIFLKTTRGPTQLSVKFIRWLTPYMRTLHGAKLRRH